MRVRILRRYRLGEVDHGGLLVRRLRDRYPFARVCVPPPPPLDICIYRPPTGHMHFPCKCLRHRPPLVRAN